MTVPEAHRAVVAAVRNKTNVLLMQGVKIAVHSKPKSVEFG